MPRATCAVQLWYMYKKYLRGRGYSTYWRAKPDSPGLMCTSVDPATRPNENVCLSTKTRRHTCTFVKFSGSPLCHLLINYKDKLFARSMLHIASSWGCTGKYKHLSVTAAKWRCLQSLVLLSRLQWFSCPVYSELTGRIAHPWGIQATQRFPLYTSK